MKVLALDISTKAGWAYLEKDDADSIFGSIKLEFGSIKLDHPVIAFGEYPWSYDKASEAMAAMLFDLVLRFSPDVIVIEETNLGKSRWSQKVLEFIHKSLLIHLRGVTAKVIYLSSSSWRQALGLTMTKEDKKNNAKLSKAKKLATEKGISVDKKTLGVRGKINKKHLALRYVNDKFGLSLKVKDNDAADAICLAAAFLAGATPCDGIM